MQDIFAGNTSGALIGSLKICFIQASFRWLWDLEKNDMSLEGKCWWDMHNWGDLMSRIVTMWHLSDPRWKIEFRPKATPNFLLTRLI